MHNQLLDSFSITPEISIFANPTQKSCISYPIDLIALRWLTNMPIVILASFLSNMPHSVSVEMIISLLPSNNQYVIPCLLDESQESDILFC